MNTSEIHNDSGQDEYTPEEQGFRLEEEVRILYELLPMAHWVHLTAAILLFGLLYQYLDQQVLFRWIGGILFLISLRVIISINYRDSVNKSKRAQFWFNLFLIGTAMYGVMWSGTALYLVPSEEATITGFTGLLLCGLAAGSIGISSVNMKVFVVYSISTLWPYAAMLIVSRMQPQIYVGWLMVFFYIIITLMALQVHRYFSNLIRLEIKANFLRQEIKKENKKRMMIEKALLDNTLEEELADMIRHQARSLRTELTVANGKTQPGTAGSTDRKPLVTYHEYLARLNDTVISQLNGARDILESLDGIHIPEEHQVRVKLAEKLVSDAIKSFEKLDIDDTNHEEVENLDMDRINIRQLLIYTTHEIPLLYKSKYITINRNVNPEVPKYIYGDRKILHDILQQLLLNSLKYSDGGKIELNVTIHSEDENEFVLLFEVEDTGVGIDRETLDNFLDTSHGVASSSSGLDRVKYYVHALGGEVSARSVLGVGTRIGFSISFMKESVLQAS